MRRLLSLGLMALLLVVGCRREPDSSVRVEFWTTNLSPTFDDYFHDVCRRFEADHPGLELVWVDLPQSAIKQKLMAAIAGGVAPDLVNLDTGDCLVLAESGALQDLSERVTVEQRQRYFPSLWEAARLGTGVYAIPWYVTTRLLIYNRRLFQEAGLDPDRPPATWDELAEDARQVGKQTRAIGYMPSIKILNDWGMFGVEVVDRERLEPRFNSPQAVARLQFYADLVESGVIPRETLSEGYRGALDRYQAGGLAILEAGSSLLGRMAKDAPGVYAVTDVAALPASPTGTVPAATMNFVIPRPAAHPQLALELALFITSPENQLAFDKLAPILPSTVATAADPYFREGRGDPLLDKAIRISVEQLATARDFSLGLPGQKELERRLNEAVESALYNRGVSARAALERAAGDWDRLLAPYRTAK